MGRRTYTKEYKVEAVRLVTTATLTLSSYHSILIDAPVSVAGKGRLMLLTNKEGTDGDLSFADGDVTFAKLNSALFINSARYTLVDNIATLASDIAGDPSGDFALANSYNARKDGTYASSPIATTFTGNFEGLGNTISNLLIVDPTNGDNVGLFAAMSENGAVDSLGLINVNINGTSATGQSIGGLVGNTGGLDGTTADIFEDFATGMVAGGNAGSVGGLMGGGGGGFVSYSYSTATVTGGISTSEGGLCADCGIIDNSYATGNVTGVSGGAPDGVVDVGGLAGNAPSVSNSYATGNVTGGEYTSVGGWRAPA